MPAEPRIDPEDRHALDELAACCDEVVDSFAVFGEATRWEMTAGSPFDRERESMRRKLGPGCSWDDEPARVVSETALFLLPVARQHLAATTVLLRAGQVMFSLAPVARAVLEIAGRLVWLFDPSIAPRQRAARSALARVEDLQRQKRTALALNHVRLASRTGQRLHYLRRKEIPAWFYRSEISLGKRGRLVVADQTMPGLRETVMRLDELYETGWNAGGLYDYLSFATHPNLPFALGMVRLEDGTVPSASNNQGRARYNFVLEDLTLPKRLVKNVLVTFIDVWDLAAQYHGLLMADRSRLLDVIVAATTS